MKTTSQKVIFLILTICLFLILLSPQVLWAQIDIVNDTLKNTAQQAELDTERTDLATIIGTTINYFLGILGVIFLVVVIIGGLRWMTAGGNEENVAKGKKFVIWGVNGLIAIFLAYAFLYLIMQALGAGTG